MQLSASSAFLVPDLRQNAQFPLWLVAVNHSRLSRAERGADDREDHEEKE